MTRLGELTLAWLLTQKKGTPSGLEKALSPLVSHRWSAGELRTQMEDTLATLVQNKLLARSGRTGFRLTQEGRARALMLLGLERLPKGLNWKQLKTRHLVARALDVSVDSEAFAQLGQNKGIHALLLTRHHQLPLPDDATFTQVRDALLWKQLGSTDMNRPFTLKAVMGFLLAQALQASREPEPETALRQLAARWLDSRRTDAQSLQLAAIRRWVAPPSEQSATPPASALADVDLKEFATRVLAAARASPSGRYGDDRVFISHVWRNLSASGMDEQFFKNRLVEANRARLLSLKRADLVEVMDPIDVAASEINYLGERFHFVAI